MSVKVGVRVRPFNQREADLNCKLCVEMIDNMTRLENPDTPGKPRDFTFDYSFWSHDGFTAMENGYFQADDDKYADQQRVYNAVGEEILSNAWQGYHCCLFAYGQTGAGKSYSMVGYGSNKVLLSMTQGIVPISCQEIFRRIQMNDNPNKEYEVTVSMMEIYNEKIQDLLIPISKRPKEGYKIREHKMLGIYVEGMSRHLVQTYPQIEQKMEEGGHNRSIAATQMNASSSRAHTIISIEFKQMEVIAGKKREKLSVIHLVDLAGSEKVGKTGAKGDRLKEATGINKSLSALGLVIKILAENTVNHKAAMVPYRNSCLTRILQNALGGNSKTLMICAISPATDNYEETLSTLKYADQAKKIQNKAVINESDNDKIIRVLKEEKEQLMERLRRMEEIVHQFTQGKMPTPEQIEDLNNIKEELRYNDEKINDYTMTKEERKMHQDREDDKEMVDTDRPHLSNLHGDLLVNRKVNYSIDQDQTKIGKANAEVENDIKISGVGIRPLHAIIEKNEDIFLFTPIEDDGKEVDCYINGLAVVKPERLFHLDRLKISANIFIILIPDTEPRTPQITEDKIDFEFAQRELYKYEFNEKEKNNEDMKMQKEREEKMRMELEAKLDEIKNQMIEKDNNTEELKKKHQSTIKKLNKQAEEMKRMERARSRRKYDLNESLAHTLSVCVELNLIAKELKRNITYTGKMVLDYEEKLAMKKQESNCDVRVRVLNRELGYAYWWDQKQLEIKEELIKELAERYFENGTLNKLTNEEDPFWDPPQHSCIGCSFLSTRGLTYMFDTSSLLYITAEENCGKLKVNIMPTDATGQANRCEEAEIEEIDTEPQDILNKPFYFNLYIYEATVPPNFGSFYVEYSLKVDQDEEETFRTEIYEQKGANPVFNYRRLHKYDNVNQKILDYLLSTSIMFKVFGIEYVEKEKFKEQVPVEEKPRKIVQDIPIQMAEKKVVKQTPKPVITISPAKQKEVQPGTSKSNKTAGSNVNNKISKKDQEKASKEGCLIY